MPLQTNRAITDVLRTLSHTGISASYAAVGSVSLNSARMIRIINNTDGDMFFSDDGVNARWYVPAGSFVLYDYTSNFLMYAANTTFYVQQSSSASKGMVAIEITYSIGQ